MEAAIAAIQDEFRSTASAGELKFVTALVFEGPIDLFPPCLGCKFPYGPQFASIDETRAEEPSTVPIVEEDAFSTPREYFSKLVGCHIFRRLIAAGNHSRLAYLRSHDRGVETSVPLVCHGS